MPDPDWRRSISEAQAMPRERILVTAKTYPTLSKKYGELVCTAGVREDGSWVRLYPIPFRRFEEKDRYAKYDWIETTLVRSRSDPRPETFHPLDPNDLQRIDHIDTRDGWRARRRLLLQKSRVYDRLQPLMEGAKANRLSLAVFKPAQVTDFIWEATDREWVNSKVDAMRSLAAQGSLFPREAWRATFKLIPKLPYNFSYRFIDADGKKSEMQVLDWECGQLYWSCLKAAKGDEAAALGKVKAKYFGDFAQKDLHFFLGTLRQFHGFSPNPWVIIGVFPVPHEKQLALI